MEINLSRNGHKKTPKEIESELKRTKKNAITAAYQLKYMKLFDDVEERINNAKTVTEVTRIMASYRRAS